MNGLIMYLRGETEQRKDKNVVVLNIIKHKTKNELKRPTEKLCKQKYPFQQPSSSTNLLRLSNDLHRIMTLWDNVPLFKMLILVQMCVKWCIIAVKKRFSSKHSCKQGTGAINAVTGVENGPSSFDIAKERRVIHNQQSSVVG